MADTVLITGAAGFIGRHLVDALSGQYRLALFDLKPKVDGPIEALDVTQADAVREVVHRFRPGVVIHLAGIKNLNYCESHPQEALLVNTESTRFLAGAAVEVGARMVFISSDYVFDGKRGNYRETDVPNPATIYGKTKFEAEKYIAQTCSHYTILRSSAVYGPGGGFFDWIVNSLTTGKKVEAFADTSFTPTYIGDVTWALEHIIADNLEGILHVAGSQVVSRYEMAVQIARCLGKDPNLVTPTSVEGSGLLIAHNSSLNCEQTSKLLNKEFLSLSQGLERLFGKDT